MPFVFSNCVFLSIRELYFDVTLQSKLQNKVCESFNRLSITKPQFWRVFKMSYSRRWQNLNPYDLHKMLVNEYMLMSSTKVSFRQRDTSKDKRDIDVIRENHQFLWEEGEDASEVSWEKKLAKRYYNKLYKEYCIADLSKYRDNKIGLRWRTEKEVIDGKGQFTCGCKTCSQKDELRSWEVNFGYVEHGVKKNALVKLRLCPVCSRKLNYHHQKKEVKRLKQNHLRCIKEKATTIGTGNSNNPIQNPNMCSESNENQIWKEATEEKDEEEKSREEEFDEYLNQLLL